MAFTYPKSLFNNKPKPHHKQYPPTIFEQFPELNQGQQYLYKRKKVQKEMVKNLQLIESFSSNKLDTGEYNTGNTTYSSCKGPTRYGWCPSSTEIGSLEWDKDIATTLYTKINNLRSIQKTNKQNYMSQINNNITTAYNNHKALPPQNPYYGHTIVVSQLTGPAAPIP